MAVAEAHLAAVFSRNGHRPIDHHTYFIASDGDIMEGLSHEAASFAGHMKLHKLIGFYDDNHITIDGRTELTFSDDAAMRFEGYGWHVQRVLDVNDLEALDRAIDAAKAETERPSLIIVRTIIGYGSPNRADSAKAHGEPLGEEEIRLTKENLGWPSTEAFFVPEEALAHWRTARDRGARLQAEWERRRAAYASAHPERWRELDRRLSGRLPEGWDAELPEFTRENGNIASRAASGKVLAAIAKNVPELIGGSADLTGSNNTLLPGEGTFGAGAYDERNMHFGIREHGMGSMMNGMVLHGGVIPYGGTFLVFSDYMRPPIRLAALMHQRVIHIFTHDSIGLGEDGPTHQPIEQLTALRCIPNIVVLRPADACETVEAWRVALEHQGGPVSLVLTRQKLGFIDRTKHASAKGVARGGYVLADAGVRAADPTSGDPDLDPGPAPAPAIVLMSSGSEVNLILGARERLEEAGIPTRVVSMASLELFARQAADYRAHVLPADVPRLAVEAAHPMSWYRWVGPHGRVMGLERFGASAPYQRIYEELGLTVERIVRTAREIVGR
jgi:transketolase